MTEKMIDQELIKLTKRAPRTQAERRFHQWLLEWKKKQHNIKEATDGCKEAPMNMVTGVGIAATATKRSA